MFGSCAVNSNERLYSLATCGRPLNDKSLPIFLDKLAPSWAVVLVSVKLILMFIKARKRGDLTPDEITIIVGALELTEKTAKDAMTPIAKAFSLDLDGTLNLWVYKLLFNFIQAFKNFLFAVYVPLENSELGHWILGVFDFTDWCIYVYDFNHTRHSDKVGQKVMLPYKSLIPYFLKKVNFYLEKGIDKSRNDTLPIKMIDELPQQI
ncbi:hypothetical protein FXO38_10667 [Capsicum annuum]|nr:hypothetical protein FXO38_10667 [Capsicum annuum]